MRCLEGEVLGGDLLVARCVHGALHAFDHAQEQRKKVANLIKIRRQILVKLTTLYPYGRRTVGSWVRESEIPVEQQPPQGALVCDHAGLVINEFSGGEPHRRPVRARRPARVRPN